jgi:hypothetical protein
VTRADWIAPDGPRWVRNAYPGQKQQPAARGVEWSVSRLENGGRVVHWYTTGPYREARTEITAADPRYPTDAELVADRRAERKAARRYA